MKKLTIVIIIKLPNGGHQSVRIPLDETTEKDHAIEIMDSLYLASDDVENIKLYEGDDPVYKSNELSEL